MSEKTYPVYIVGQNIIDSRFGEPALVVGLKFIKSQNGESLQLFFHIRFIDGEEDYIPFSEVKRVDDGNAIFRILEPDEIELKVKEPLTFI